MTKSNSYYDQKVICKNFFPSDDESFQKWLTKDGNSYQLEQLLESVKYCNGDQNIAIDAGANVGLHSKLLARLFVKVMAFEPCSKNRACIYRNIPPGKNNVIVYPYALGREEKQVKLWMHESSCGAHTCLESSAGLTEGFTTYETAFMSTIDSHVPSSQTSKSKVSLIKIDVQGLELDVLKGANKTLIHHRPIIMCEIASNLGYNRKISRFLSKYSYKKVYRKGKDAVFKYIPA